MEMSEEIYANVEVTEDNRADSSDGENSYEDINEDNLKTQRTRSLKQSESSGGDTAGGRCYRVTAVCLLLLCVLLLTAVTVLWIKFNNLNTENNQIQTSNNNLIIERDQLQTSYNTLTIERDQLQTSNNNLTIERDQLQTSYNTLTIERDQLQREREELQRFSKLGCRSFNSKFYYISTEKKNWTESRQDCINRGADLMIINSEEEQEFVVNISKSTKSGIYIGLTDREVEGKFRWVDGKSLTTAYWSSRNGNSDIDDCVVEGYRSESGWYDRPCNENYYWICE